MSLPASRVRLEFSGIRKDGNHKQQTVQYLCQSLRKRHAASPLQLPNANQGLHRAG
jgi:hypothetical protein